MSASSTHGGTCGAVSPSIGERISARRRHREPILKVESPREAGPRHARCTSVGAKMTSTCESFTAALDHPDWAEAPLWQLIEHIVHRHHSWLRQEMTLIEQMMDRVVEALGVKRFDSILPLRRVFSEFQDETLDHLR